MWADHKPDVKRCKKHENARVLYTSETCPLCDTNETIERLIAIVDSISETNDKISAISKTMERLF